MGTKMMGLLIKINRINQNMSQKALCQGICVPSYLSKIENGEIIATSDMINLLFEVLGITYNDSQAFIATSMELFDTYLERLTFNDFHESSRLFREIEKNHSQYIHSPLIIDYYIIRLARYCSTKDRVLFEEPDHLLKQVITQMTNRQQLLYNLYKAIDLLQLTKQYEEALTYLTNGLKWGENGHIYYWLSITYMYKQKPLLAIDYANKALQTYLKDGNVTSMMCTYELMARIYMTSGEYEDAKDYLLKAMQICSKLNESYFQSYLHNKLAWCLMCLGKVDEALQSIQKDKSPRGMMMKLDPYEVRAILYNAKKDKKQLENLLREAKLIPTLKDSKVLTYIRKHLQNQVEEGKNDLSDDLIELLNETEKLPDIQHYFRKQLISYYKGNRRYKEAVMLLEENK